MTEINKEKAVPMHPDVSGSELTGLLSVGWLVETSFCGTHFYQKYKDAELKKLTLRGCTGVVIVEIFKQT